MRQLYYIAILGASLVILRIGIHFFNRDGRAAEDDYGGRSGEMFARVGMSEIMAGKPIVLPQDDKHIINYIWSNGLIHSPSSDAYSIEDTKNDPSRGQAQFIRKILKDMKNGFFIECGALDGETRSNTLFLEMFSGWKGLLVEGDPSNFALLKKKNRKAWSSNTCLAIKPYPHKVVFQQRFNTGKILDSGESTGKKDSKSVEVQCMPLFSLLTALNVTTVDYFSLDVEGNELQVLKTIPFDKITIRTLSVEYIHTAEGKEQLKEFMISQGYKVVGEVHYKNSLANDVMFALNDLDVD